MNRLDDDGPPPIAGPALWSPVGCALDEQPWASSIGLIALAGDAVIEPEMRTFLGSGTHLHTTRVAVESSMSDLKSLGNAIHAAAGLLLPGYRLDGVAFGCTSGALALGSDSVRAIIRKLRPGAVVTDPLEASLAEFALRGVRSVAVLSPYTDSVNSRLGAYLSTHGIQVVAGATFRATSVKDVLGRTPPNLIATSSIFDAAIRIGQSTADAVFISCTGLRCAAILGQAEKRLRKPVISSNQALAAHVLRLADAAARA